MAPVSPLAGLRVLITRPRHQADGLVQRLVELGALPVIFPAIEIAPLEDTTALDEAIRGIKTFDWVVFTSANGVSAVWERLAALKSGSELFARVKVAAIGPATAQALREHQVQVDFMPDTYVAEAIADGLGSVAGVRVLLLRADIAREAMAQILEQRGAQVRNVPAYRTVSAEPDPAIFAELERGVDVITLTSASTARSFAQTTAGRNWPWLRQATVACIGPITADAARACGFTVQITAKDYTAEGLVTALIEYFEQNEVRNRNEQAE
jgi:uroporphyrinogen-III synthase